MITVDKFLEIEPFLKDSEVIIFDLDDTLYSEKDYVRSGYKEISKMFPQIENFYEKLWLVFMKGLPAIDVVLQEEGVFTEELKLQCLNIYRTHKPSIFLYDGVLDVVQRLKKEGKKIGVITEGRPEGQWNKIRALGVCDWAEHIIITDELGGIKFRKPNPTAFVKMQEFFNIPFDKMVYVGDNIRKDFIAPEKLGMKSIYFKNKDGIYYDE